MARHQPYGPEVPDIVIAAQRLTNPNQLSGTLTETGETGVRPRDRTIKWNLIRGAQSDVELICDSCRLWSHHQVAKENTAELINKLRASSARKLPGWQVSRCYIQTRAYCSLFSLHFLKERSRQRYFHHII
jgi:hypothetical protein